MDALKHWPLEGIGVVMSAFASVLTALNAGKIAEWWRSRQDRDRTEREARKTARVLLETIELKNLELEAKDRIIARQDREQERMQEVINNQREYIARHHAGKDGSP